MKTKLIPVFIVAAALAMTACNNDKKMNLESQKDGTENFKYDPNHPKYPAFPGKNTTPPKQADRRSQK
ncbi:hypothetical protein [Duganella sp. BuS-21]|uniref:hypothetical protein n=1 Tax=Duganella sp. BuS-21 TaxID=2943848 RepID=UPI0035A5B9F7